MTQSSEQLRKYQSIERELLKKICDLRSFISNQGRTPKLTIYADADTIVLLRMYAPLQVVPPGTFYGVPMYSVYPATFDSTFAPHGIKVFNESD